MGIKYLLPCSCGECRPIELRQAGETVACRCGAVLEVPAMREIQQNLEPHVRPGDTATGGQAWTWGRRECRMFLGVILTIIGLGLLATTQVTRPKLPDIGSLSPIQTWMLWQDLRKGPDRHLSQLDQQFMEQCTFNRIAIAIAFSLASAGMLVTVTASLMRKRRPLRSTSSWIVPSDVTKRTQSNACRIKRGIPSKEVFM